MFKHTQLEIYFTANATQIDLTSHHNFTCSIPPWFINIETVVRNDYGACESIPRATLCRMSKATGAIWRLNENIVFYRLESRLIGLHLGNFDL